MRMQKIHSLFLFFIIISVISVACSTQKDSSAIKKSLNSPPTCLFLDNIRALNGKIYNLSNRSIAFAIDSNGDITAPGYKFSMTFIEALSPNLGLYKWLNKSSLDPTNPDREIDQDIIQAVFIVNNELWLGLPPTDSLKIFNQILNGDPQYNEWTQKVLTAKNEKDPKITKALAEEIMQKVTRTPEIMKQSFPAMFFAMQRKKRRSLILGNRLVDNFLEKHAAKVPSVLVQRDNNTYTDRFEKVIINRAARTISIPMLKKDTADTIEFVTWKILGVVNDYECLGVIDIPNTNPDPEDIPYPKKDHRILAIHEGYLYLSKVSKSSIPNVIPASDDKFEDLYRLIFPNYKAVRKNL